MPPPPPHVADSLLPSLPAPCSVPSALFFTASSMSSASTSLLGTPSWAATTLAAAVPGQHGATTTTSSTLVPAAVKQAQLRRRHRGCLCTYGWNMKMKHEDVHLGRECLLNAAKEAHISPANLIDMWVLTKKAKPEWISYGGGYHLSSGQGDDGHGANDIRHPWLGPVAQALVRVAFRRLGLS